MTDMRGASRNQRRAAAKYMAAENEKFPADLARIAIPSHMAAMQRPPMEAWRSKTFLVQIYETPDFPALERMSVNRCALEKATGNWSQDISWEELQDLKRQCGREDLDAVEIYPRAADVVNVANMRHLWIFREGLLPFAWRKAVKP